MSRFLIKTIKTKEVSGELFKNSYALYKKYRRDTNYNIFVKDLKKCLYFIYIYDKKFLELIGFCSVSNLFDVFEKNNVIIFSGEAVIHENYTNKKLLQTIYCKHFLNVKLSYPFRKVYFLTTCDNFKIYLLMERYFSKFYPRWNCKMPKNIQSIIDASMNRLFPNKYISEKGIIRNYSEACPLKQSAANITPKMIFLDKKTDFFQKINSGWREGDELVCIGLLGWLDCLYFSFKFIISYLSKHPIKRD